MVVSDADCVMPVHTMCNTVSPSSECQLVLRHFFNDSGIFCINVSMTNDVSLAVTSAKVSVTVGMYYKMSALHICLVLNLGQSVQHLLL